MIKTRLIGLVPESKRYIAYNVLLQWLALLSNAAMVICMARLLDGLRTGTELSYLHYGLTIGIAVVIRVVCVWCSHEASYYASRSVKRTLRAKIYEKVLRLGNAYTEQISTAEVVQLAGEGVEQLETYFGNYLPQFFYALLAPLTLFVLVSRISLKTAVILLVCVPLIPMAIVAVQKIAKRLLSKYWGQYAELGDNFLENLQGLTTLKIYQADADRHQRMNKEAEHFRKVTMKVLTMQLNSIIVMDIIAYGGAGLGILMAVAEKNAGKIDFFGCLVIILLAADFFLPMRRLGSYFHVAMNGMAASDKIFRLLDLEEEKDGTRNAEEGSVALQDVNFSYSEETQVLFDVNMDFAPKSFTALVGVSGCGKSTVAGLLMGRIHPASGSLTLNNVPLGEIKREEWMKHTVLISHNSYLFQGSLKENLLLGKEEASEEELWQVLEQTRLADFVRSEGGLEMHIAEGGLNLSGGQRQRVALARALLHDASIYLFDEATSNIDAESEADILSLIHQLAHRKTVILITHRLASVVGADRIYVMDQGHVVQEGVHDALVKENGVYRTLWQKQRALEEMLEEEPHEENEC